VSGIPSSTYRIQLRDGLTLDGVVEQGWLDHARELGVSHLYLSPVLEAVPGSTHGYDVVDPRHVDPVLGGDAALRRLATAAAEAGMGLVVDIVPNHMAADHTANPWWWDVLRNGDLSEHAAVFDVDPRPPEQRLRGLILLPVLDDHYGRLLDQGRIRLRRRGGSVVAVVDDRPFPLEPSSLGGLLAPVAEDAGHDLMRLVAMGLRRIEADDPEARLVELRVLDTLLALCLEDPMLARAVDEHLRLFDVDPDAIHEVLESQRYRLAHWRAARDLGYRRFFDVNELIGVSVESPHVFDVTHGAIRSWIEEGLVDGLRVDHPDGMADPALYLDRLRATAPSSWIVVEKILEQNEDLPSEWDVAGTTGYEFAEVISRWLIDPRGLGRVQELNDPVVGATVTGEELIERCKRLVLQEMLAGDLDRVTDSFLRLCDSLRLFRDVTRHDLQELLREVTIAMPVYRTYVSAHERLRPTDLQLIRGVIASLASDHPEFDPEVVALLGSVLTGESDAAAPMSTEVRTRLQQLTGPAMAKGKEDTAFYRDVRLISRCEVGSDPSAHGIGTEQLHAFLVRRQREWPDAMTALSTHDSKRSEDVRARLNVLTEVPDEWARFVGTWTDVADALDPDGRIDHTTRSLLCQTMVGAHPIDAGRLGAFALKAVREAKSTTSWLHPDAEYERAVTGFAERLATDPRLSDLVADFVRQVLESPGRATAVVQKVLHLCAPGVPDLYWGSETWFLRLVDPDNRGAPDLAELAAPSGVANVQVGPAERSAKAHAVRRVLALRARRSDAFSARGTYRPLEIRGEDADRLVAFARNDEVVCVAARWPVRGAIDHMTTLRLPPGEWCTVLGGAAPTSAVAPVGQLLGGWSVAVLERT